MPISNTASRLVKGAPLAGMLCLAGCASDGPSLVARSFTPLGGPPVTALEVQDNAVTIKGPAGYCIDRTATRERADGTFAMLGDCAQLYKSGTETPEVPAVLTALVSGPSDQLQRPSPAQLQRFFRSEDGRAALSLDGDASTVTVDQFRVVDGVLLFSMQDTSAARPEGLSDRSWRAVLSMRDRLISLAVTAHLEQPLSDAQTRKLLGGFIAAMREGNESDVSLAE